MHLSMVSHISSWSPDGTKLVYKPDPKASPKRHTPTQPDHNAIQVSKMQRLSNDKLDEIAQARVVKSCSRADSTAWAFSQVQDADRNVSTSLTKKPSISRSWLGIRNSPEGRAPQAQVSPSTGWFSEAERSQVHWPAGRAPELIVSVSCFSSESSQNELTARAAGTGDGVLSGSLVAGAVKSTLLATGTLGLGSADTASILGGSAAGGRGVDHFDGVLMVIDMTSIQVISSELESRCSIRNRDDL